MALKLPPLSPSLTSTSAWHPLVTQDWPLGFQTLKARGLWCYEMRVATWISLVRQTGSEGGYVGTGEFRLCKEPLIHLVKEMPKGPKLLSLIPSMPQLLHRLDSFSAWFFFSLSNCS